MSRFTLHMFRQDLLILYQVSSRFMLISSFYVQSRLSVFNKKIKKAENYNSVYVNVFKVYMYSLGTELKEIF